MTDVIEYRSTLPVGYDPQKGLQTIAVTEAAEKLFARAKDVDALYAAVEAKIDAQAAYCVWRDGVVLPGSETFVPGVGSAVAAAQQQLPEADPGKFVAFRWREKFTANSSAEDGKRSTVLDPGKIALAKREAQERCRQICEQEGKGGHHRTIGTGEEEWHTPPYILAAVRKALGGIDLDPASNAIAQETVQAAKYFTKEDDGLKHEWHGRVYLNPPYSRNTISDFADKLIEEWRSGRVSAAIVLVNAYTETQWFRRLWDAATAVCFTDHRVEFVSPEKDVASPVAGQALFYFGDGIEGFASSFETLGTIVQSCASERPVASNPPRNFCRVCKTRLERQ